MANSAIPLLLNNPSSARAFYVVQVNSDRWRYNMIDLVIAGIQPGYGCPGLRDLIIVTQACNDEEDA